MAARHLWCRKMKNGKAAELERIRREIENHPSNAWAKKKGYQPVYTTSEHSKIVIIGQAPGIKAQESHIPWNDKSGENLREWLGISTDDFYNPDKIALIPMDFYFPGSAAHGDKPPRKEFADMWHQKLLEHMSNVQLTILIGQYAQKHYLGKRMQRNLTETVHAYKGYLPDYLPLVHPSPLNFRWQSKNPWFHTDVLPHAKRLVKDCLLP